MHDAYVISNSNIPGIMDYLPEGGWMLGYSGYLMKDFLMAPFNNSFILIWRKDLIILTVKQDMSWHMKCSNLD